MNTKGAQLFNNKKMWTNMANTLSSSFSLSFTCLLKVSNILIILSQNLITTIFIALKSSSYEESFPFAPSPMLESKQRTKYHINCEIVRDFFIPCWNNLGRQNLHSITLHRVFRNFRQLNLAKSQVLPVWMVLLPLFLSQPWPFLTLASSWPRSWSRIALHWLVSVFNN